MKRFQWGFHSKIIFQGVIKASFIPKFILKGSWYRVFGYIEEKLNYFCWLIGYLDVMDEKNLLLVNLIATVKKILEKKWINWRATTRVYKGGNKESRGNTLKNKCFHLILIQDICVIFLFPFLANLLLIDRSSGSTADEEDDDAMVAVGVGCCCFFPAGEVAAAACCCWSWCTVAAECTQHVWWCVSQSLCWQNELQYCAVLHPLHVSCAFRPQFQQL